MLCTTQTLQNIICMKKKVLSICIIYLLFFRPEPSLNFSNFDRQDFVKIQNFDGYDVSMTSFSN